MRRGTSNFMFRKDNAKGGALTFEQWLLNLCWLMIIGDYILPNIYWRFKKKYAIETSRTKPTRIQWNDISGFVSHW